jgi:hypothetical protein
VLGVIFNGADASSRNYYYYKYADYNTSGKTKAESDKSKPEMLKAES